MSSIRARLSSRWRWMAPPLAALLVAGPAAWADGPSFGERGAIDQQLTRNLIPEPGFFIQPWAEVPAPTALAWGPERLYVTSFAAGSSTVMTFVEQEVDGQGWVGTLNPTIFTKGVNNPLGIEVSPDGTKVFVADSHSLDGATVGRVQVFDDADVNGVADGPGRTLIEGLPQGRHNTNNLVINPVDGQLYVTNGNQTDAGELAPCAAPTVCEDPLSGTLLRIDPDAPAVDVRTNPEGVEVVARRMRNVYDVAFWPGDATLGFMPMNGSDSPASDDVLYRIDTDDVVTTTTVTTVPGEPAKPGNGKDNGTDKAKDKDTGEPTTVTTTTSTPVVDDMGFPVCLYNSHPNETAPSTEPDDHGGHGESLEPMDNPIYEPHGVTCPDTGITKPVAAFGGHVSANGVDFARGGGFSCSTEGGAAPCTYRNDLFVAEWGNLNGAEDGLIAGRKVVRVDFKDDGSVALDEHGKPIVKDFVTGGAPIDVAFRDDGNLYVADMGGFIYKMFWHTPAAAGPTEPSHDGMDEGEMENGDTENTVILDGGAALGTSFEGNELALRSYDDDGDGEQGDHTAIGFDGPGEGEGGHGQEGMVCAPTPEQQAYADALLQQSKEASRQYDGWAGFALARRHNFWPYPVPESKAIHMTAVSRGKTGGAADPYAGLWNPFADPRPADERPANIAPPFDELSEGYYYENAPHVLNPWRMESFVYAMVDDWDGNPANGMEAGPKVVNAMFTFPYLTDADGKVIPAPNPTGCLMMWHGHTGAAGVATSFDPNNPENSPWMAHVYVIDGVDPWSGPKNPGEAHSWFGPYRLIPATCAFDSGCIP